MAAPAMGLNPSEKVPNQADQKKNKKNEENYLGDSCRGHSDTRETE
jgi:hypothetical protein